MLYSSDAYKRGYHFPTDPCPYKAQQDILEWEQGVNDSLLDEMADSDSIWFEE